MKRALILSPLSDQALAVARYLREYGTGWVLHGGFMPGEQLQHGKIYDQVFTIRDHSSFADYEIVLPTGAESTEWMARHCGSFTVNGINYSQNNLKCFDKARLLAQASKLDIPIPKTYETIEAIDISFPIFYKQRRERGGGPRGVVWSRKGLDNLPNKDDLLFQEYIPGRATYGVGFIFSNGEFLTFFQHAELLSYPLEGGSAVIISLFADDRLKTYTQRILNSLNFEGWGLAEFKYCPRRRDYVFMEVNAKLWASIEFAFMNNSKFLKFLFGIDYPEEMVPCAIYIERLIALGCLQTLRNTPRILNSRIISYRTARELLCSLARNSVPPKVKVFLKAVIKDVRGVNPFPR